MDEKTVLPLYNADEDEEPDFYTRIASSVVFAISFLFLVLEVRQPHRDPFPMYCYLSGCCLTLWALVLPQKCSANEWWAWVALCSSPVMVLSICVQI